jgi:hypothetical protein
MPTSTIARPSKIYPNWDFCFENLQSGNPGFSTAGRSGAAQIVEDRDAGGLGRPVLAAMPEARWVRRKKFETQKFVDEKEFERQ